LPHKGSKSWRALQGCQCAKHGVPYLANFHDDFDTTNDDIVRPHAESARLARCRRSAFERGIFGAPTFLIGSELYWGNDRLDDALTSCVASS
jgi:hypothetical protein